MCFIPEHTAFLTQKLKQALTDRLPCLWVKLDGSLLPWKEFPTRLSPKLGDGVLDRPWEQVGTVHSLRNNWVPCYWKKWRAFNWFFVHRSGFICAIFGWPKGWICDTGWHFHGPPLPTGSSWVGDPPLCHTESIFDTERILPKQGIDHTVRSSLCQGQMFILLKCIHLSLSIILDCCSSLFQPSHTQCTWIMGKSFLCMGHGQDFLLGLSAFLVDCPDAWSSELSIQKAPRRNKNSWLLSVGLSDSPNHTVYAPIQWRKALSIFLTKVSLQ